MDHSGTHCLTVGMVPPAHMDRKRRQAKCIQHPVATLCDKSMNLILECTMQLSSSLESLFLPKFSGEKPIWIALGMD